MQTVFMVGERRSGSNLLRLMLNKSGKFSTPHAPSILLEKMMPLLGVYGDLKIEDNFLNLIEYACKFVELDPVKGEYLKFDRADIRFHCRENTLIAIFGAIMSAYAKIDKVNSWLCKSMQNIRWASAIDKYFDNTKYVFLYRDGRDTALSFKRAPIGEKHTYFIAQQWSELQQLCLSHKEKIGESKFFSVCYEQLIREPKSILIDLCKFLEIEFKEDMLSFYKGEEVSRIATSSELWKNISSPVISSNSGKYKKEMPKEDIKIFESVAGDVLDKLNYHRDLIKLGNEIKFSKKEIDLFQKENQLLIRQKEIDLSKSDPDDFRRRGYQIDFLNKIRGLST